MSDVGYETFFGLAERPFSLTPDPRYLFKGHSHGRALESLTFGFRRDDAFLLLTGDLGVGKTTVCRALVEQLRRRVPVAFIANPLLSVAEFESTLVADFGVTSLDDVPDGAAIVIDEAHNTPTAIVETLIRLSTSARERGRSLPALLACQPLDSSGISKAIQALEANVASRARLLPFGREDCSAYVAHRLAVAGGDGVTFTTRATDVLFNLSGGVPRLVNLLCERALHETAAAESRNVQPEYIEAAASALELLRARPRRFRWYHKHVS